VFKDSTASYAHKRRDSLERIIPIAKYELLYKQQSADFIWLILALPEALKQVGALFLKF